jgi:hypothetical protein
MINFSFPFLVVFTAVNYLFESLKKERMTDNNRKGDEVEIVNEVQPTVAFGRTSTRSRKRTCFEMTSFASASASVSTSTNHDSSLSTLMTDAVRQQTEQFIADIEKQSLSIENTIRLITSFDDYLRLKIDEQTLTTATTSSSTVSALTSDCKSTVSNHSSQHISVNFGGKCLTLDRNVICNPKVKFNFFSALFHPRWQRVLPKDQEGRLYFELEYKWIQPILDAYELLYFSPSDGHHKNQNIDLKDFVNAPITNVVTHTNNILTSCGIMGTNAHILEIDTVLPWIDTDGLTKTLLPHLNKFFHLENKITQRIKLTSANNSFNSSLVLAKGDNNVIYGFLSNRGSYSSSSAFRCFIMKDDSAYISWGGNSFEQKDCIDASNGFKIHHNEDVVATKTENSYGRHTTVEYFRISNSKKLCQCPSKWLEPRSSTTINSTALKHFVTFNILIGPVQDIPGANVSTDLNASMKSCLPSKDDIDPSLDLQSRLVTFSNMLSDFELCLDQECSGLRSHLKFKSLEGKFIRSYLQTLCFKRVDIQSLPSLVDEPIDSIPGIVHVVYDDIAIYAGQTQQHLFTGDVLWFNVRGECVCLLKSTILRVIPNSQLGLQFGNKPKRSVVKKELVHDKEGRIIVVSIIFYFIFGKLDR